MSSLLSKPLRDCLLTAQESNEMLEKWHYSREVQGILFSVGHDEGCCVFTNCRSRVYEKKHLGVVERREWSACRTTIGDVFINGAGGARMPEARLYIHYYLCRSLEQQHRKGLPCGRMGAAGATGQDMVYMLDGERVGVVPFMTVTGRSRETKMKEIYGDRLQFEIAPPKPIFIKELYDPIGWRGFETASVRGFVLLQKDNSRSLRRRGAPILPCGRRTAL